MTDFNDHCWKDVVDEEILEIYAAYRRETYVGPAPAVLAIDLYRNAYGGGNIPVREANRGHPGSCGENAWKAIEPTQRLIKAARTARVPVIYTTRHADTGGVKSTNRQMQGETEEQYAIIEALAPQPGERVIYKERASAFFGTPLVAHLRDLRVESLIICGESTSGCVRAGRLFLRFPQHGGGGMYLRPLDAQPQSQPIRPASQIRRCDARRTSHCPSRQDGS